MARQIVSPCKHLPGEAGAALVEFALVLMLVMMILMGIFTGGLAYNNKITLTDAARAGARYATTHPIPTSGSSCNLVSSHDINQWMADVACDTEQNAQGELAPGSSGRTICVYYVPKSGSGSTSSLTWTTSDVAGGSCPVSAPTASSTDNIVAVVVQRTADFNIVLWHHTVTLQSQGYGRYEETTS